MTTTDLEKLVELVHANVSRRWRDVDFDVTPRNVGTEVDPVTAIVVRWSGGPSTLLVRDAVGFHTLSLLEREGDELDEPIVRRPPVRLGTELPGLADDLAVWLAAHDEDELAAQVHDLPVLARCCDAPECASFHTVDVGTPLYHREASDFRLVEDHEPGGNAYEVSVVSERIDFVRVLNEGLADELRDLGLPRAGQGWCR